MMKIRYLLLAAVFAISTLAMAGPADALESESSAEDASILDDVSVGLRVGGYGFRHMRDDGIQWNGCRMDGTGAFAQYDFSDRFFAEVGFDMYHAIGPVVANGMERLSLFQTAALGVRSEPLWRITPYLQLGGGAEWTRVEVDPNESTKWLGLGFVGVGSELAIGQFSFGATLRVALMGDAEHSHDHYEQGEHLHGHGEEVGIEYEPAGHALFFAKMRL